MRGDFVVVGAFGIVAGVLVGANVGRGETAFVVVTMGVVVLGLGRVGPATQSVTTAPIV